MAVADWKDAAIPAGMVEGSWFLRSPQVHCTDQHCDTTLSASSDTYLGVDAAGTTATLALLATELALRRRSTLLLDLEEWTVGMCATRHSVPLDAGCARVLLVVDENHGRGVGDSEGDGGEDGW